MTFVIFFALHFVAPAVGTFAAGIPVLRSVSSFVSFDERLTPFARGMINTRDVVYFVSITIACLMASFRALERRKWA